MNGAARRPRQAATALVAASHPGPSVVVTAIALLLAFSAGAAGGSVLLLGAAVLAGQLTIGWSNDLLDAARDRASGRADKPVASGVLGERTVKGAVAVALLACVALSLLLGSAVAALHLVLVVGSGWAYNLGLKATVWSWVPYAVAFGSLPAVARAAAEGGAWVLPPWWMPVVGALLGVGAHLLNALPDLTDDVATGVRGLPHRLGARTTRALAPLLLLAGAVIATLAPVGPVPAWGWAGLVVCVLLAVVGWAGRGRTPFVAAMLLALTTVAGLVLGAS